MTRVKDTYDRKTFSRQEWKEYVLESALPFDVTGAASSAPTGSDSQLKRACPEPSIAHLLLNYFVVMSYEESSIRMAKELGYVRNNKDASTFNKIYKIRERASVRELIKAGRILEAIEKIYTEFGVQVFEPNRSNAEDGMKGDSDDDDLHFELLLLNLIEMIRRHHQSGASPEESSEFILELIEYSQERLALKADSNTQYMKELELVMTLLLFPMEKKVSEKESERVLPKSLRNLYSLSLRTKIADSVNRKLLESIHSQISMANADGKFPDLVGLNTAAHQAVASYNGMFVSNNDEDVCFETPSHKPNDLRSNTQTPLAERPWQHSAWKATSRLIKQQERERNPIGENTSSEDYRHVEYEARLIQVMKLWAWCENQLHNCGVGVPRVEGGV
ncbi:LAME_0F17634g1_1 [Lachancea meyersii CBS 8951]|uniref:LAME_0F17634g1_1 n=1 Tax=Lachancea meyersii CBS 8951 TaxID=1266667 RepID=A0A1G4K002_9SACH|nr:LAME_0F17634g1_1 [Lachancea meyersii CBS 8951]